MTMHITRRGLMMGGAAAAATLAAGPTLASGWRPQKPIEMVIMGGQGGGADRLARLFQTIIQKNRLSPMPIVPVNKGGGSGAEALRYLKDKAGDPHVIMATLNSYYTTPLRSDIGVDIAEFTPLARMALDTFALWVNPDSGITNLDQFVERVRAAGGSFRMAGTGTGQEDSLITAMLEQKFDIRFTYIPFDGGGDVARALVGGHADSTVNNPSEAMSFGRAGRATALAAFTTERIPAMPDTPTFLELGHEGLVYDMQRSFVAPGGLTAEQVAFYDEMLRALSETEEWRTYAEENALVTDLLTGDELQAYFLAEREKHAELLASLAS
ncbi:MAG: Bug family tripartite tricarboxylate transporter substrate binding protein [Rubrimonas sp.]